MSNVKIKICGLTSVSEAEYLNENKADFAGMVLFFPKSKRNIDLDKAGEIIAALDPKIKKTAVVVAPTAEQIESICALGFDYIQIHSTLTEEALNAAELPVLKAFNVKDMDEYERFRSCDKIAGYVFDAADYGSGKTFDWELMKNIPKDDKMLFLAGGLDPYNVAEAIKRVRPDGVDVSSGVEYDDKAGKDPAKIRLFCENARNN